MLNETFSVIFKHRAADGICSNSFLYTHCTSECLTSKMYIFSIIAYSNKWSGIPILQKENSFKSQIKNYTTIALVKLQKQSITKTAKKIYLKSLKPGILLSHSTVGENLEKCLILIFCDKLSDNAQWVQMGISMTWSWQDSNLEPVVPMLTLVT